MHQGPGIELSILDGMDEALLERLHEAGIRSRSDLAARIATPDGRQALARELGVSSRRLQILHHLNFLLPEERAERELDLERRLKERSEVATKELHQLWRVVIVGAAAVFIGIVAVLLTARQERKTNRIARQELTTRVADLERSLGDLLPIGRAYAEDRVLAGLTTLGPAPGWVAPRAWAPATHEQLSRLLTGDPAGARPRAVSLLLMRLSELTEAPYDSLSPLARAQQAAALLTEFPPPEAIDNVWDAAAVLLRTRLRGCSYGLAPLDDGSPLLGAARVWEWTSPGFLTCEELLTRLESMPLSLGALEVWSQSLLQIRSAADAGRADRAGLPEAFARDYWIRRAELEYGLTGALLGRATLLPYHSDSPRAFLETRRAYLNQALATAPPAAQPGLAWLAVEFEEALRLVDWLATRGVAAMGANSDTWMAAISAVETKRAASGIEPGAGVEWALGRAVDLSGEGKSPWTAPRTLREAGIRPLLMETRAGMHARSTGAPAGS